MTEFFTATVPLLLLGAKWLTWSFAMFLFGAGTGWRVARRAIDDIRPGDRWGV